MQIEIEYFYCLGINLFYILYFSIGYICTDRQYKALQFLILIIVPILVYAYFTFAHSDFTLGQTFLGTLVVFIILVFLGEIIGLDLFYKIPYPIQDRWWWNVPYYIFALFSVFGVPIIGFMMLYLSTTWIVTLIVFGVLFLIFLILFLRTNEDFSNWATPLIGKFDLLVLVVLLGYFAWPHVSIFINIASYTVFIFILIHYIVDGRKSRGLTYVFVPHHTYYSGYTDVYPGASAFPLGLALSAAIGFTSWFFLIPRSCY